jgi:hypothetical protein
MRCTVSVWEASGFWSGEWRRYGVDGREALML